ncbi:hypothetical protein [Lacipirellula parvula]|uniref:Uncharacterized protein n=1 Tax=Lacipirellula parvula TaxID=2650471 RepID=A0A5K7X9D7_9BACT|nr:hypothetical protein [Lacipirellula parvula]BBO33158.1 hypothetical protein PLANPX_2770 [Lacipirellula parvula]
MKPARWQEPLASYEIRSNKRLANNLMRTARVLLSLSAVALASYGAVATAEERYKFSNPDNCLTYFATSALLMDRGVAVTYFAPTADQYVLNRILTSPKFREELGIGDELLAALQSKVSAQASHDAAPEREPAVARDELGECCEQFDSKERLATRIVLQRYLTKQQHERLASVYLNLEGLLALRRRWFAEAGYVPRELQQRIVSLAQDKYILTHNANDGHAGSHQLHAAVFALRNDEMQSLPAITANLRRMSASLDLEIISLLNAEQKKQLADVASTAIESMREFHAFEEGAPKCMYETANAR